MLYISEKYLRFFNAIVIFSFGLNYNKVIAMKTKFFLIKKIFIKMRNPYSSFGV